uniref:F-box domain-containing protein n=1 Tax=Leersia perrieri TaxID=77586 RepID=A0A0D9XTD3_9ORYZ
MTSPGTSSAGAGAAQFRDWSALPEDLLLTAMSAMQVPDLVHSGAVCRSWRSAFAAFRRLRLPSPPHPPCLLYSSSSAGDVTLYSPATGAHFRVPLLTADAEAASGVVGSANGWVFTTDARDANPYLLNPLTGERAALPPITTLRRVRRRRFVFNPTRGVAYDVEFGAGVGVRAGHGADGVAMSGSPSSAGGCVVLLLHNPHGELSFARPGGVNEQWTTINGGGGGRNYLDAVHNPNDGLFYALEDACGDYDEAVVVSDDGDVHGAAGCGQPPDQEFDKQVNDLAAGVGDGLALFLGNATAAAVCVDRAGAAMLRGNCAYLTDDYIDGDDQMMMRMRHTLDHELAVWEFESNFNGGRLTKLRDTWPLHPSLRDDSPLPVWFTPSPN